MDDQIRIERLSYGSAGIGHTADGKAVFVEGSVPGDVVGIELLEEKPRYNIARIVNLVEASKQRLEPECPYYASCGGCPWQHITYPAQLTYKRDNVVGSLIHTAGFDKDRAEELVLPCKASKREFGYRNKLELGAAFLDKGSFALGFNKEGSHNLVAVDACMVAHKPICNAPKALGGALRYIQGQQDLGIFRVGIRHSLRNGEIEVALWTKPGSFPRALAAKTLGSALKTKSIVRVMAHPGKARSIKGVEVLSGKGYWEEKLGTCIYKTSAPSFFQVNTAQAEFMIDTVQEHLDLNSNSVVADLYAGGGTFSIPLAKHAGTVFAIESASSSIRDLRRNADSNNVSIEIIGGDSARELPSLGKLDALVVDPPRQGLSTDAIKSVIQAHPKEIAYISCNPSTWARDVSRFEDAGFVLTYVHPVDLFPQTYHIELVSFFRRETV